MRWLGNTYNITDIFNTYSEGTKEINKITDKMLILHGRNDITVELKYSLMFKDAIPNCVLKIVENAGHCLNFNQKLIIYIFISVFCGI